MKIPRVLFTSLFLFATVAPASSDPASTAPAESALSTERTASSVASRSAARTAPLVIPPETTTTTAAPVTTTTPPTTAAPVTTTTAAPRVITPPTTAAPTPVAIASVAKAPAAAPVTAPAPVESAGKDAVVSIARAQVGKAYVSGGKGPNSFDCSGLVFYVFNQAGFEMPRLNDAGYYARSQHITRAELQPGDIIKGSGHIGIYVGDGMMVHASTSRGGVKLAPIDAAGTPKGYGRLS